MALTLRKKLSPEQAAAYAGRIERERLDREREDLKAHVRTMREREQGLLDAQQGYENRFREEADRAAAIKDERELKRAEAALEFGRQQAATLRAAEQRRTNVQEALRRLSEQGEPDLSSPEAAIAAAERAMRVVGLRELLEQAETDVRRAEMAAGRHRRA